MVAGVKTDFFMVKTDFFMVKTDFFMVKTDLTQESGVDKVGRKNVIFN